MGKKGNKYRRTPRELRRKFSEFFDPNDHFCRFAYKRTRSVGASVGLYRGHKKDENLGEKFERARKHFGKKRLAGIATVLEALIVHHKETGKWIVGPKEIVATSTRTRDGHVLCVGVDHSDNIIFPVLWIEDWRAARFVVAVMKGKA